jgi:sugar lactone lactonase YvrE
LFVGALRQDVVFEFSSADGVTFTENTFAGISNPETLVFDPSGNLFVANGKANSIKKITPSGVKTTIATGLDVDGMAVDAFGNLFVSRKSENTNASDGVILKFTPDGKSSVFVSNISHPKGLAFDSLGNLYLAYPDRNSILKFTPNGKQTTFASGVGHPFRLAFDGVGNLFVTDVATNSILEISPSGVVSTLATDTSTTQHFNDLAFDSNGNLFATFGDSVMEFLNGLTGLGDVSVTIAAVPGGAGGIAIDPPTTSSAAWSVMGAADFNQDGHPDYLLFNSSTRQTAIWYLNNNVLTSGLYGPSLPAGWSVVGVADFNGDGHPDYLLFSSSTRQTAIWYLDNNVLSSGLYGPTLPVGWTVVGVADFNGDGKPDYLLYNGSTQRTVIWYLNNNVLSSGLFGPALPAG